MEGGEFSRRASQASAIVAGVALVVAAYFGREFLVPVAIACLLAALLAPIASRFERWRVHRVAAAMLCVLLLAGTAAGLGAVVARQIVDLSARLPNYKATILSKLDTLQTAVRGGPLREAREGLEKMEQELRAKNGAKNGAPKSEEPVAVKVVEPEESALEVMADVFGPVLGLLASTLVVLLLTGFLLASRADIRERLVRWMSLGRMVVTTQAIEDASRRVSRYLGGLFLVNVVYGVSVGIALALLEVPNAPLWALLAGLLRFVPFVGTWIGAAFPLVLAFAVFDGWSRMVAVGASFLLIDLLVGNFMEPVVLGRRAGIPPFAVILATVFWTWLWGVPGLLLAVPMTVCLSVVGRYAPALRFLDVLFGQGPGLSPTDRLYQRLLALDTDGARRVIEADARNADLAHTYDEILLPALALASADRHRGEIDDARAAALAAAVEDLAETAATRAGVPEPGTAQGGATEVWLLPADGATDAAACALLERLLASRGVGARLLTGLETSGEVVEGVQRERPKAVCVAGLPPFTLARVRYLCRRIHARVPEVRLVAGIWDESGDRAYATQTLREAGAAEVRFRLADAAAALAPAACVSTDETPTRADPRPKRASA